MLLQLGDRLLGTLIDPIGDHDDAALLAEPLCSRPADALPGPGDDADFAFEAARTGRPWIEFGCHRKHSLSRFSGVIIRESG
jgi:hypothetical protein